MTHEPQIGSIPASGDQPKPKCPQCGTERPTPPHGRHCACGHDWKPALQRPGKPGIDDATPARSDQIASLIWTAPLTLLPALAIGAGVFAACLGADGDAAKKAHAAVSALMSLALCVWTVAWSIAAKRLGRMPEPELPVSLPTAITVSFLVACPFIGPKSMAQMAFEALLGLG